MKRLPVFLIFNRRFCGSKHKHLHTIGCVIILNHGILIMIHVLLPHTDFNLIFKWRLKTSAAEADSDYYVYHLVLAVHFMVWHNIYSVNL